MGPGPSNVYPSVLQSMNQPLVGHLDPEFLSLLDETNDLLRQVFKTSNRLTFPVSGTGTAGMETALVNFIQAGDSIVVGVNGVFGSRMCDAAERLGANVIRVDAPWGEPIEQRTLLDAYPSPKAIALVHAETSTGVRNDVDILGSGKGESLLILDCVTSLGGIPVELDEWKVDIAFSGSQKCLSVPPGLSPFSVSETAREKISERPPSWYLDLNMISRYVDGVGERAYHHTAPISMIYALNTGLRHLHNEGLEMSIARHENASDRLKEGLERLGFRLFAREGNRLPQLTTVWVPEGRLPPGRNEADLRRTLLENHGIEIGGGLGEFQGRIWRIGLMGHSARPHNVDLLLNALEESLD